MAEGYLSMAPRKRPFLRGCLTVLLVLGAFFALLGIISRMDEIPLGRGGRGAVVPISGLIAESEPIIEQLKKFGKDESVKAIVLRIDSPGGGVGPSQEIYEEVKKVRMKKPVLASMGALAASGGYYIACAAQRVYANPGTMTGSIGVIMPFMNVKDLVEKIGVKGMTVKSGVFKDIGSPLRGEAGEDLRRAECGHAAEEEDLLPRIAPGGDAHYNRREAVREPSATGISCPINPPEEPRE